MPKREFTPFKDHPGYGYADLSPIAESPAVGRLWPVTAVDFDTTTSGDVDAARPVRKYVAARDAQFVAECKARGLSAKQIAQRHTMGNRVGCVVAEFCFVDDATSTGLFVSPTKWLLHWLAPKLSSTASIAAADSIESGFGRTSVRSVYTLKRCRDGSAGASSRRFCRVDAVLTYAPREFRPVFDRMSSLAVGRLRERLADSAVVIAESPTVAVEAAAATSDTTTQLDLFSALYPHDAAEAKIDGLRSLRDSDRRAFDSIVAATRAAAPAAPPNRRDELEILLKLLAAVDAL